jgi:hypothetical protein
MRGFMMKYGLNQAIRMIHLEDRLRRWLFPMSDMLLSSFCRKASMTENPLWIFGLHDEFEGAIAALDAI